MRRPSPRQKARQTRLIQRCEVAEPAGPLSVEVVMTVCTQELAHELESWLPSAAFHHPEARLYVVGDYPACQKAREVAVAYGVVNRVFPLPLLGGDGLAIAGERCRGVAKIHRYWRADVIWWKLEGLRQVLSRFEVGKGVLLTDCDITFAGTVRESWVGVDVVLSPFYWVHFDHKVRHPVDGVMPLAQRDGYFNAGYLLTRRVEVAEYWMELYESGVGGFYEQKCLERLPGKFACDYFSPLHNWGKWRREVPRDGVVSIHFHDRDVIPKQAPPWLRATKEKAEVAAVVARRKLLTPFTYR